MKKVVNFAKNVDFLSVFKYFLIFFAFFVLNKAGINQVVYPFAFAFLFALVWCDFSPYILSPLYVVSSFLSTLSLTTLLCASVTGVFLIIVYLIHSKFRKPIKVWLMAVYAVISQGLTLYYGISGGDILFPILSVVLGVFFYFCVVKFFQAIIVRGVGSKLSSSELICGGIILLALTTGMTSINIFGFEFVKLFAVLVILCSCYTFGGSASLVCAGIMGVGAMLWANQFEYCCVFLIWALISYVFKFRNKIFPIIAVVVCEVALGFCFNVYGNYTWISGIPVVVGSLIFLLIPSSSLSKISGFLSSSSDRFALKNIVNRNRDHLSRRLGELSDVFNEMNKVFRSMIKGGLSVEEAKVLLVQDIKERNCAGCPEINRCHRAKNEETISLFHKFISIAFERGRVGVLDIPPNLTSRCPRTTQLIATVNEVSDQYKKYAGVMSSLDASKILIAEQLGGISGIMKALSSEVSKNISFDVGRENKIADELNVNGIVCSDVVVYEQGLNVVNVTIIVKEEGLNVEKIEKIAGKICGCKLRVNGTTPSPHNGLIALSLATAPKFDVIFGSACRTKTGSETSGDAYSVIRIENDKFLLALCDGMGSGVRAEKASSLAMGLVENFYKAGFDSDIILSCVNKLLSIGSDDVFSALDLCVMNLRDGTADLIKLGAPCGYIKRRENIEIVEGSALPMGIVASVQPYNKKIVLGQDDYIVLCTDGISDSFMSEKDLSDYILQNSQLNPQELSESIVEKAVENCSGVALDDMSVIVAKVYRT